MSERGIRTKFMGFGILGSLGVFIAAALGADGPSAIRETFSQTAERWGLWAALAVAMVLTAVVGLILMVRFVLVTMSDVIDDNTLSHEHYARVLRLRPCIHDSDVGVDEERLSEDDSDLGETAKRAIERRRKRKEKRPATAP